MINPNPPANPSTQQQLQAQQLAQLQQLLGSQQGPAGQAPMASPWEGAAGLVGALMSPQGIGPGSGSSRGMSPTFGSEQPNQWYDDQGNPVAAPQGQANSDASTSLLNMIFGGAG